MGKTSYLIEARRRIQASENWVISSGNGLSPAWCEAITWTNVESLPHGLLAVHLKL